MIQKYLKKIINRYKSSRFKECGENVEFSNDSHFAYPERIIFGSHIYVGPKAYFIGLGGIKVSDNVIFGPMVTIHSSNHNYRYKPTMIPYDGRQHLKPVYIGPNTWIGSNVCICPGISIGEGVIIAMGSVVTNDIPDLAICGGNPAKIISYRNKKKYDDLKANKSFYMKKKYNKQVLDIEEFWID